MGTLNPVPHSPVSTQEKRSYLRQWATERSGSDPAKLPIIREAKEAIKRHFGDIPGAGLGTDIITEELRNLRNDLMKRAVSGTPASSPTNKFVRLAWLTQLMAEEGIEELKITRDGDITWMKTFPPVS